MPKAEYAVMRVAKGDQSPGTCPFNDKECMLVKLPEKQLDVHDQIKAFKSEFGMGGRADTGGGQLVPFPLVLLLAVTSLAVAVVAVRALLGGGRKKDEKKKRRRD